MNSEETLRERVREVGIAADAAHDPLATIRLAKPANGAGARANRSEPPSRRELPKISIDLRGTLSEATAPGPAPTSDERDLEILRTLGEGGMARVFLARQHSLDREVAIKTVRDSATDVEHRALLAEGAITGHLEHPGIVPVHALGLDREGRPALVMKWVEGATWSEQLNDAERPLDEHLEVLIQVCNAVDFAHSRGVIHRDIKPDNVLLGRYGEVYLADWGVALRLEGADVQPLCGTPSYMAPEMVVGGVIDARTDVYLLGATLHRLLSGVPRHVAKTTHDTLAAALSSEPVDYPSTVPLSLALLANAATSFDPEERPQTAAIFRQHLAEYLRHKGSITLAESAEIRIENLAALLARDAELADPSRQREIDVLAAEARFAIEEARRAWVENPIATHAEAALEELLGSRRSRAAALEQLARELDPRVSRGPRAIAIGVTALAAIGLAIGGLVDPVIPSVRGLFWQSLIPVAVVAALVVTLRRHLLGTALNRRSTAMMALQVVAISVHRGLALGSTMTPAELLLGDIVLFTLGCALGAVMLFRWLWWTTAILFAAAIWVARVPSDAMRAFSVGTGAGLLACAVFALGTPRSVGSTR